MRRGFLADRPAIETFAATLWRLVTRSVTATIVNDADRFVAVPATLVGRFRTLVSVSVVRLDCHVRTCSSAIPDDRSRQNWKPHRGRGVVRPGTCAAGPGAAVARPRAACVGTVVGGFRCVRD